MFALVSLALALQGAGVALVPQTLIDGITGPDQFRFTDLPGVPLPYAYFAVVPRASMSTGGSGSRSTAVAAILNELVPARG